MHSFDSQYFGEFTPNKAYTLGLLMSDGCIAEGVKSKGSEIRVPTEVIFSSKDVELVQYVKGEFQATYPVTEPKAGFFRFSISSRRFAAGLARFGLVPRKNTGLTIYPNIPSQFDRDFIRGIFDGDGYVGIYDPKHRGWQVINMGWTGSKVLLIGIRERLTRKLGTSARPLYPQYNGFTFELRYCSKRDCLQIFRFLYLPDCCMKLERKYMKALGFFKMKGLLEEVTMI